MRVPLSQSLWLSPVTQPPRPEGPLTRAVSAGREMAKDVLKGIYSTYGSLDANLPDHIGKTLLHNLLWSVEAAFDQISGIDFAEPDSLLLYVY